MNWLYYLIEANAYLGVFYLAYCLLLIRDTHYQLNRAYLILSSIISFILPVLQVGALKPVEKTSSITRMAYLMPAPVNSVTPPVSQIVAAPIAPAPVVEHHRLTLQDALWYAYLLGAAVFLLVLILKLATLLRLIIKQKSIKEDKHRVIWLPGTDVAFSFFNYLFIGDSAAGADTMMRHELVHIRQWHSVDILFMEILKIVNWFNPFIYLLQNSLKTVHEYIADEHTAAYETDALDYSSFLVQHAYGAGGPSIAHSFFNYNLLKKRIIMLNQQRSGNLARLKYLVALPICAALLCASTLVFSKSYGWVDLAPAKARALKSYAAVNPYAMKRKRLKVTQNGVTTITDQFSIDPKNKNIVYTVNSITNADKAVLLKTHKIKVDIIEDSTLFTTNDGRPVLPVVNVDGYYALDHFLHHNIHYSTGSGEKGGLVEVGFTLDNERHITDLKIVKSGGAKLNALAFNGFNAYKGTVNDDAGKSLKLGVYFFTNDYSIFKTDSLQKEPGFAGELIVTNYKYPANVTGKGYEYDESGIGFPGDNTNTKYAKVVIYDKNGDANWFFKSKMAPADLALLKDKYGYTFPSGAASIVQMMYPKSADKKRLAYIFDVASYLDAPYANDFYNYMTDNTQYPEQAKKALTGGTVVLDFNLGSDGLIGDVKIAKSAGNGFDESAVNALRSYRSSIKDNAGKHSIAVVFCVAEKKNRPAVNDSFKKDGYVGELAISDVRSPFGRPTITMSPAGTRGGN